MSGLDRTICRGCISDRLRLRQGCPLKKVQLSQFRMGSMGQNSRKSAVGGCSQVHMQCDAHLEYRRRTGKVINIFYGYQIKERELFPLIHVVSTSNYVHDNNSGTITAGAAGAAVVAMDWKVSYASYP